MKVLFVARKYPPSVGGMQKFSSAFYNSYKKVDNIDLVANPGDFKRIIPFFVKLLILLPLKSNQYDVIHFGDGVLAPFLVLVRLFSKAKVSFTVHGLDIVYSKFGYQKIILPFLRSADRIFSVSQYTLEQCLVRGIEKEKLFVITNCIDYEPKQVFTESDVRRILFKYELDLNKKILVTVGRLIKRKGHVWFLSHVLPRLPDDYIYVIAGDGVECDAIQVAIEENGMNRRVFLLGRITDEEKACLYQFADLFIMPNIRVEGDQEGFGIVCLEAQSFGLPVIAANLEGIADAVLEGKTGRLVGERNVDEFVQAILKPDIDRTKLVENVVNNFDCLILMQKYHQEFKKMCA